MKKLRNIIVSADIDWKKVDEDILFLKSLNDFAIKKNWKFVLYGGYSLDFALHTITRTHRDIDVVIYGQLNRTEAIDLLESFLSDKFFSAKIKIKNETYFVDIDVSDVAFAGNIYYVQTVDNPMKNILKVIKSNNEIVINSEEIFPLPLTGMLNDVTFNIQDQNAHLADILVKYDHKISSDKYTQDISNLKLITDKKRVEKLLSNK